ncbi:DUF3180 domain-containing protein [Spongiactinospora gelatinilytica]|uniref:DUF3180 domain-containing protein n=1 Tax=Spongiactinospora gelatinilytica TaxID=2666298 RepID=A0A2W2GY37_9ACTN|nr:DUF3180 domain-containing protein [Spongiactinospora gelatinilytica]PZG42158.1 DUF3180 domain-containing protein [Spongiactinospora gelatinilytica]
MKPTKPLPLVGIFVVVGLLTWALLQRSYSMLPTVPWTAIPTVLLLAAGELISGVGTRNRIRRRPGTKPVEPLAVARLAALAKASAYAGAVFGGVFAGFVLHVMQMLEQAIPLRDFYVTGGSLLACVALVCAALFLEYCCRIPKDEQDEPGEQQR